MNDFQIISKLGEGAYSTVYKVKRNIDNKIYALKKVKLLNLSEKEKENSLNEVRILASVKSNKWGLGIGDWGLGIGDGAQSTIPNPQTPNPNTPYPI